MSVCEFVSNLFLDLKGKEIEGGEQREKRGKWRRRENKEEGEY